MNNQMENLSSAPSTDEVLGPDRVKELSLTQSRNTAHLEKLRALADELERNIGAVDLYLDRIDTSDLDGSIDFGNFYQALICAELDNKALFEREGGI